MKNIYTSVDIGSDTIKVVVCELLHGKLNLLAASSVKSKGIKKGLITNFEEAMTSLQSAILEVEQMLGIKIKHAVVCIPSYFAEYVMVKGAINILSDDHAVKSNDIDKVIEAAVSEHDLSGKAIITTMPIDFTIDSNKGITNPVNMQGMILSMRGVMVTTPKKNLFSVLNLFDSLKIDVDDVSINGIGDYYTFRNESTNTKIGAVVNIGAETTTISLLNKGIVVKSLILQTGGYNIDNDISYIFKVSNEDAIKIKEQFALAHKKNASANDFYEVEDEETIKKINQYQASEIVMARLEQILNSVKEEINDLTNRGLDYIIFTGGTSNMTHFSYVVNEIFENIATVGKIKIIGLRNNKYSSAIGNILYFVDKLKLRESNYSMFTRNEVEELSTNRESVTEKSVDSMLSKVFGYFFGE